MPKISSDTGPRGSCLLTSSNAPSTTPELKERPVHPQISAIAPSFPTLHDLLCAKPQFGLYIGGTIKTNKAVTQWFDHSVNDSINELNI